MSSEREHFKSLNATLKQRRLAALNYEMQIKRNTLELEKMTGKMQSDIASEVDPETCKPKYSNSDKRDTELLIRQTNSEEWCKLRDTIDFMTNDKACIGFECSELEREIAYMINHPSDEIDGALREFRVSVCDEIKTTCEISAKLVILSALRELTAYFENSIEPEHRPEPFDV